MLFQRSSNTCWRRKSGGPTVTMVASGPANSPRPPTALTLHPRMTSHPGFQFRRLRAPAALLTVLLALSPDLGGSPAAAEAPAMPAWALHDAGLLRRRGDHLALLGAADWHAHGV